MQMMSVRQNLHCVKTVVVNKFNRAPALNLFITSLARMNFGVGFNLVQEMCHKIQER